MQRNQNDGFYGVLLIPIKHYTTPVESGDLLCTIESQPRYSNRRKFTFPSILRQKNELMDVLDHKYH